MKSIKYLILVIGILGILAFGYELLSGKNLIDSLLTLVCSGSLLLGYFEISRKEKLSSEKD